MDPSQDRLDAVIDGVTHAWLADLRPTRPGAYHDDAPDPANAEFVQCLGDGALAWALEVADEAAAAVVASEPRFGARPATIALVRQATRSNILRLLLSLATGQVRSLVTSDTTHFARHFVASEIPFSATQAGLRATEIVYAERLLEASQKLLERERWAEEARYVVLGVMRIFDEHLADAGSVYERELDRGRVGKAAVTREVVMRILADEDVDEPSASETVGYKLTGSHVAFVLSGPVGGPPDPASARQADLDKVTRVLLDRLRPPSYLCVPVGSGELWMWCELSSVDTNALENLECVPAGVRCAVGSPVSGVSGFRISHVQAQEASRFVRAHNPGESVAVWRRVGLDALLSADRTLANQYVIDELGELADDRPEMHDLRQTLASYLLHGYGLMRPARELHVNRNTVSYRIHKIERMLDYPVAERSSELQIALRLHSILAREREGGSPER